jgi:hypothetical protein
MSQKNKTEAEKLFLKYKQKFIKNLGKDGMYNDEFKKTIPFLTDVYAHDTAKVKKGYFIINTDISTGKGEHWIACYITDKRCYLYDSFSRTPKYLVPLFVKKLEAKNIKIFESDPKDKEQYGNTQVCGQLCCAWLCVVKELGIRKAMTI